MTNKIIDTKKYEEGIWTPWGEVLCYKCHGKRFACMDYDKETNQLKDKILSEKEFKNACTPIDLGENMLVTNCNKCNKEIQIDYDIAIENNLVNELKNLGIDACMYQSGGMNSACLLNKENNEGYYLVVFDIFGEKEFLIESFGSDEEYLFISSTFDTKEECINHILNLKDLKKL